MAIKRNSDATRRRILDAAFAGIYKHGYQATSIDAILKTTGLTKGGFYHHFKSKKALGQAVIDEVLSGTFELLWVRTLEQYPDPIEGIKAVLRLVPATIGQNFAELGCPLNNLSQEMSPIDEDFRTRLNAIFHKWIDTVADALKRGQQNGCVLPGIDPQGAAIFIIAAYEGAISMTKNEQTPEIMNICASQIELYLEGLRV